MTDQGNVSPFRSEEQRLRAVRGAFVQQALERERWSTRKAAGELGISHTSLGDRFKGKVSFLAEDIADIARLLGRDPVDFFRDFLNQTDEGGAENLHLPYSPDGSGTDNLHLRYSQPGGRVIPFPLGAHKRDAN